MGLQQIEYMKHKSGNENVTWSIYMFKSQCLYERKRKTNQVAKYCQTWIRISLEPKEARLGQLYQLSFMFSFE